MEKKWLALVAVSAAAAAVFVGCSCGSAVENSMKDSNTIVMQSEASVFTVTSTTTEAAATVKESIETTSAVTTSTTEKTTTGTRAIQFVGRSEAQKPVATTQPKIVTQIVVVTVTVPATTTTTETETTTVPVETQPLQTTIDMPDGIFHPEQDVRFIYQETELTVGSIASDFHSIAIMISSTDTSNGGTAANIYTCDGFDIRTEVFTYEDGSSEELIMEIILTGSNICTPKGISVGSSVNEILAAYGSEHCEIIDTNVYHYQTEDGHILDFYTDGSYVTEIRYDLIQQ